ncbi:MAG: hypothetical protein R3B74_15010 [Nitrospirales bacterium]|nr:hypothetical protein [Nitrospirales bacterium]
MNKSQGVPGTTRLTKSAGWLLLALMISWYAPLTTWGKETAIRTAPPPTGHA